MLQQARPNPARTTVTLRFVLPDAAESVSLILTDLSGHEVAKLIDSEALPDGVHAVVYDTRKLPSGAYFYTLYVGDIKETGTMQIVR